MIDNREILEKVVRAREANADGDVELVSTLLETLELDLVQHEAELEGGAA